MLLHQSVALSKYFCPNLRGEVLLGRNIALPEIEFYTILLNRRQYRAILTSQDALPDPPALHSIPSLEKQEIPIVEPSFAHLNFVFAKLVYPAGHASFQGILKPIDLLFNVASQQRQQRRLFD
jgi:hypothetical protein